MTVLRTIFRCTQYAAAMVAGGALLAACAAQTAGPQAPAPTGPQGARGTPEGCPADKMADDALMGKPEAEAISLLQGCAWRLGERDGQQFPGTMDYNPQRRTLGVKAGKVVWVRRG